MLDMIAAIGIPFHNALQVNNPHLYKPNFVMCLECKRDIQNTNATSPLSRM